MAAEDGETQNVLQELSEDLGFQEDDGAEGEVLVFDGTAENNAETVPLRPSWTELRGERTY